MFPKMNFSLTYGVFFLEMGFGTINESFLENIKYHLIKLFSCRNLLSECFSLFVGGTPIKTKELSHLILNK